MVLYELYLGGRGQRNSDSGMFPSPPFNGPGSIPTMVYQPYAKTQPATYAPCRVLDFSGFDESLSYFLRTNPIVVGDTISADPIPNQSVLLGVWWKVVKPLAGVSFSIRVRNLGITLVTGQSAATVNSGFAPAPTPNPYLALADIVDVGFDSVPLGGIAGLGLLVTPYFANFLDSNS